MKCEHCGIEQSDSCFTKSSALCNDCIDKTANIVLSPVKTGDGHAADGKTHGTIKWFSNAKGYGFITLNDNNDVYFHVKDLVGSRLPENSDKVSFIIKQGSKGVFATDIEIIRVSSRNSDDRISCPSCGKKMVPRIIVGPPAIRGAYGYTPEPKKSVCPYCGSVVKTFNKSNCFIATAVYNDNNCYELSVLRSFRDSRLMHHYMGVRFVSTYYNLSPRIALFLERKSQFKSTIKIILDFIVFLITRNKQLPK